MRCEKLSLGGCDGLSFLSWRLSQPACFLAVSFAQSPSFNIRAPSRQYLHIISRVVTALVHGTTPSLHHFGWLILRYTAQPPPSTFAPHPDSSLTLLVGLLPLRYTAHRRNLNAHFSHSAKVCHFHLSSCTVLAPVSLSESVSADPPLAVPSFFFASQSRTAE